MISGFISRFKDASAVIGPRRAVILGSRWLFEREFDLFSLDLQGFAPAEGAGSGLSWEDVRPDSVSRLDGVNPALSRRDALARLQGGQLCSLASKDGQAVHYRWECSGQTHLSYLDLDFAALPGDLLSVEVYTSKSHRRQGIHSGATILAASAARQKGFKRFLCFIAPWNLPTQHLWRDKLRARQVGGIKYRPLARGGRHQLSGSLRLDERGRLYLSS